MSVVVSPIAVCAVDSHPVNEGRTIEAQPSVRVNPEGDVIELFNPTTEPVKFEIFSITGQLIKSVVVKSVPQKVELPKGFYIVKCDNWTKRIMLK